MFVLTKLTVFLFLALYVNQINCRVKRYDYSDHRPPAPPLPFHYHFNTPGVAETIKSTKTYVPPVSRITHGVKTASAVKTVKTIVRPPPPLVNQVVETEIIPQAGYAEPYDFNFNVNDNHGNSQFRKEESDTNGVVRGSYGYTDANGLYRIVEYVADENGFRANIKSNEPGLVENPEIGSPASIKLTAEETPRNLIRRSEGPFRRSVDRVRSTRYSSFDDNHFSPSTLRASTLPKKNFS